MKLRHAIRFVGKISWEGQANGLPENIYAFLFYQDYNRETFGTAIDQQMHQFTMEQGMHCQRVQGDLIDMTQMPQDRQFVPMQWIVSIRPEVINFSHELPLADEQGVERLSDGSEPPRQ